MNRLTIEDIEIEIERKNVKNIRLSVHPPNGSVRLCVPEKMDNEAIKSFIFSKLAWVKKQRNKFNSNDVQAKIEFLSGEEHYYLGAKYLLNIIETTKKQHVSLRENKYIDLYVRANSTVEKREKILNDWYRQNLKTIIPECINKWEDIIGVSVDDWAIKRMKTRWGTCNIRDKRIWINLELAKKSPSCIEYVVVHELVHLLERYHNDVFKAYMTEFLPNWKSTKKELNNIFICN